MTHSKYHREIKPGVFVDVYDVLHAWAATNPALQHLIKKALQPGARGHKTWEHDMDDIVLSDHRARDLVGINRFHDLCNHPAGAKAFEPACAWHSKGTGGCALSNRVFG